MKARYKGRHFGYKKIVVGQKYVVVNASIYWHNFPIGSTVTVVSKNRNFAFLCVGDYKTDQWLHASEVRKIGSQPKS